MSSATPTAGATAKAILKRVGLLPLARRISDVFAVPSAYRNSERRFRELKRQHAQVFREHLSDSGQRQRVALIVSPSFPEVEIELGLVKGLELANFVPVVLIPDRGPEAKLIAQHYKLAAVDEIHQWDEFEGEPDTATAEAVRDCLSLEMRALWLALRGERARALKLQCQSRETIGLFRQYWLFRMGRPRTLTYELTEHTAAAVAPTPNEAKASLARP